MCRILQIVKLTLVAPFEVFQELLVDFISDLLSELVADCCGTSHIGYSNSEIELELIILTKIYLVEETEEAEEAEEAVDEQVDPTEDVFCLVTSGVRYSRSIRSNFVRRSVYPSQNV